MFAQLGYITCAVTATSCAPGSASISPAQGASVLKVDADVAAVIDVPDVQRCLRPGRRCGGLPAPILEMKMRSDCPPRRSRGPGAAVLLSLPEGPQREPQRDLSSITPNDYPPHHPSKRSAHGWAATLRRLCDGGRQTGGVTATAYGRAATERRLERAALDLIASGGLLSGITMQQVGDAAGVTKGLVYHYFGDRQALFRSALRHGAAEIQYAINRRPYAMYEDRVASFFRDALAHRDAVQLTALLMLDRDPRLRTMPLRESSLAAFAQDAAEGRLAADADACALLGVQNCLVYGYVLFRDGFARQMKVDAEVLDGQMEKELVALGARAKSVRWDSLIESIPRLPEKPVHLATSSAAAALEDAALDVLRTQGVLAGVNLRLVAKRAGVHRGLIYHYFGSRRELLLSALRRRQPSPDEVTSSAKGVLGDVLLATILRDTDAVRLMALLALDGDSAYLPMGPGEGLAASERDTCDVLAACLVYGHALYRQAFSGELGVALPSWDRRVFAAWSRVAPSTT